MGFDLYCIRRFWLGYYQVSVEFDNQAILCWISTMDYSNLYRNIYQTNTKLFINVNLILSSAIYQTCCYTYGILAVLYQYCCLHTIG